MTTIMFAGVQNGDQVTYSCNEGFTLNGDDTVTCNGVQSWTQPPQCDPSFCTDLTGQYTPVCTLLSPP